MRGRSHTHNFRLGADYDIGKDHALSFVYNGAYATSHTRQHTTGTQTATNLSTQTSWLHNGRLDYEAPIGLKPPQRDGGRPHGLLHHGQAAHQCLEVLPRARTCAEERLGTELRGDIHHERGQLVPVLL